MTLLYDLLYGLAALLGWPYLIYRRLSRGPGSLALGERFGNVPSRPVAAHCIWIHGVSLGEINATRPLVAALHQRSPDLAIVISSTTKTGLARARELYPKLIVFRFPLDFSFAIRRVLNAVRPSLVVLMELEVWPNLVEVATQRRIPLAIANGRITDERSMRGFEKPIIRRLARRMFRQVRWVGAQSAEYAARFVRLGVPPERVEIVGSLKDDAAELSEKVEGQERLAEEMTIDLAKPVLVCGSTGPQEEAILLGAYRRLLDEFPQLQLVLVPRKPERFDEVADLVRQRGLACLRRSGKPPLVPAEVATPRAVFLGDTLGELRKFYGLATIVFIGRSLVPMGGSDVMEAAALGKPLVFGPHMDNFRDVVEQLLSAAAAQQVSADALAGGIGGLLRDAALRARMSEAAREVIRSRRGATARTVERLLELVT